MGALFVAASAQALRNTAPSPLDYPITVGMWLNLTAVGTANRTLWCLSDTATTNNFLALRMTTTELMVGSAAAGGATANTTASTALIAATWNFALARFINATNRRVSILHSSGLVEAGNSTTSTAPTGMDLFSLGSLETSGGVTEPWDGRIGEYWIANADVQPDGLAASDALVRQLAYGGPFSVPHIAKDILEYRSFRKSLTSDTDEASEIYFGAADRQLWTNTNAVTIGPHPPLPYWYVKPGQVQTELVI